MRSSDDVRIAHFQPFAEGRIIAAPIDFTTVPIGSITIISPFRIAPLALALTLILSLGTHFTAYADDLDDGASTAGDTCIVLPNDIPIDSSLGSAGFMKNIAEHPESIRAVAKQLLTKAVESPAFKSPPACEDACPQTPSSKVVYKVEPTVFLAEAEQNPLCLTLEEQTKRHPMKFDERSFESLEKLNEWIMEFSQGRGDDGKLLYEQCGANCSPRYTFYIGKDNEALTISADVLCGLARDKKSEQYLVSTAVRWTCEK